ncbi:Leucine-rich repeat-containing protein 47 [Frankliniella fusca]|uniref:Leucine-rich repeat-containing protein 47 n=1 Tax=Frankliniella fusca TaxID=407009 RepID=A0AAE1L713_9NEOP|nr:Leucine-rich repeat-containing protein 47 [Frankliniella fusca]
MSGSGWSEITTAKEEKRHELILSGPTISDRIAKTGLDPSLFDLTGLNFLRVSETCLEEVPDTISNLQNLSTLVLHSNKIKTLTSSLGKLSKLKNLDVSRNQLEKFPEEVADLSALYSLNASFNKLTEFPSLLKNSWLTILDLSNNAFEDFPDVCSDKLCHLAEVRLGSNNIKEIPHSINALPALKLLDLSENKIKDVPGELSDITKLKELNLKGNPLSDKRLGKMVLQCHSKQVLEYIRQHCKRDSASTKSTGKGKKGNRKSNASESDPSANVKEIDEVEDLCNKINVMHVTDSTPAITVDKEVLSVRPYIVCCIVRGLSFNPDTFKKFIKMQNNLHDTICNKRQAATIATHDLAALSPGSLKYVARVPDQVKLQPLGSTKDTLASVVYARLKSHAHSVMQDKKRNRFSGIHKFLYLLEGQPLFPFLIDGGEKVISFPPLTNSNVTKMSVDSKDMLVEVTSSASLDSCKKVMNTLLLECLKLGIGQLPSDESPDRPKGNLLTVEQVKIVDSAGILRIVYPARSDLIFDGVDAVKVIRNYE